MAKLPEVITAKIDGVVIQGVVGFKINNAPPHPLLANPVKGIVPKNEGKICFADGRFRDFLNGEIEITVKVGV